MSNRSGGATIQFRVDARELTVPDGISVAAALMNAGLLHMRRSTSGEPRTALCGMGSCHECRMTIDGVPHRRACLTTVREGMHVRRDG